MSSISLILILFSNCDKIESLQVKLIGSGASRAVQHNAELLVQWLRTDNRKISGNIKLSPYLATKQINQMFIYPIKNIDYK